MKKMHTQLFFSSSNMSVLREIFILFYFQHTKERWRLVKLTKKRKRKTANGERENCERNNHKHYTHELKGIVVK